MAENSPYVYDQIAANGQPHAGSGNSGFDKITEYGSTANDLLTVVDRVVNPQKYSTPAQPAPHPVQQSGFGFGKVLLVAAGLGTAAYMGNQWYNESQKKGK